MAFVPKIIAMVVVLALTLPWVITRMVEYSSELIASIPAKTVTAMQWLRLLDPARFLLFTLILTRVSGLVMTAPIYGTPTSRRRSGCCLAFVWRCWWPPASSAALAPAPGTLIQYLLLVGSELLVGVALGHGGRDSLFGIEVAGTIDRLQRAG